MGSNRTEFDLDDAAALRDPRETASLLRACGGGDRAAFRHLYELWGARLHGIALRITRQPSLAADATHDAFVQVWQRAARFDPARGSPEAWLVSLVRYRALDIVRNRARQIGGYEPADEADKAPDAFATLVQSTEGTALKRCLDELDPERRRIVLLAYVDGFSHGELSARLSLPLGTIKSWIRRGLRALRDCLEAS